MLKPQLGTKPRVWYRNLERFDACFIGGSISMMRNAVMDCLEGAGVELRQRAGAMMATTTTDAFGDFRFDGLAPDSGSYEIRIAAGELIRALAVTLGSESIYLGEITLR